MSDDQAPPRAPVGAGTTVGQAPSGPGDLSDPTSTGLDPRTAAVLAYSAWWITGALFLALEPAHRFVRFHARQSLLVFGLVSVVGTALWLVSLFSMFVSPALFRLTAVLAPAVWVCGLALWIACLVQAGRGVRWQVPVVGDWLAGRERQPRPRAASR